MATAPASAALLAGRYRLVGRAGQGGMGTVWTAYDERLERPVAVKVVPLVGDDGQREAARLRFRREVLASARLNHPGVVAVFDAFGDDDHVYLVMELVEAPTLDAVVRGDGPLGDDRVAGYARSIADALAAAHRAGVVHCDVKPANVLLTGAADVKVADFGIARFRDDSDSTATGLGSPGFMPPEQVTRKEVGPAADVWAFGATLYFALEGHGPFERDSVSATLAAIVDDAPPRPRRAGADLADLVVAMMATRPAARPSLGAVRSRLGGMATAARPAISSTPADAGVARATQWLPAASGRPVTTTTAAAPGRPVTTTMAAATVDRAAPTGVVPLVVSPADRRPRRRRGALVAAVVAVALLAALIAGAVAARPHASAPAAATTTTVAVPTTPPTTVPTTVAPAAPTTTAPDHGHHRGKGHGKSGG